MKLPQLIVLATCLLLCAQGQAANQLHVWRDVKLPVFGTRDQQLDHAPVANEDPTYYPDESYSSEEADSYTDYDSQAQTNHDTRPGADNYAVHDADKYSMEDQSSYDSSYENAAAAAAQPSPYNDDYPGNEAAQYKVPNAVSNAIEPTLPPSLTLQNFAETLRAHRIDKRVSSLENHLKEILSTLKTKGARTRDVLGKEVRRLREAVGAISDRLELTRQEMEACLDKCAPRKPAVEEAPKPRQKEQTKSAVTRASCLEWLRAGYNKDGPYQIHMDGVQEPLTVYCDMRNGGWMIIQKRRWNGLNFTRNWQDYKWGFGEKDGEYWLGNEWVYQVMARSRRNWQLRVDVEHSKHTWRAPESHRFSLFEGFQQWGEGDDYRMRVDKFVEGSAGPMFLCKDTAGQNNDVAFSTWDRDNDKCEKCNCATDSDFLVIRGGGWWYHSCDNVNLNSMNWQHYEYRGGNEGKCFYQFQYLRGSEMKIRPEG